jgi:xylulokinase
VSVLALDIGSSRIKALLADATGRLIDDRSLRTPHQAIEPGERAYPAQAVYKAIEELIGGLAQAHHDDPIDTLVFSCLGTAMVPVDRDERPLAAALAPADSRPATGPSLAVLVDMPADELFHRTGSDPLVGSSLLHYLWWQRTHPEVMANLHRFRSLKGFALQLLCGVDAEDPSWASRSMLMDLETGDWSEAILAAAGLPGDVLPELHPATSTWPVRPAVCESLGLAPHATAVLGALDNCCALFGSTDVREPALANIVGTYEHLAGAADLERSLAVAEVTDAIVHTYLLPDQYIAMTRIPMGDLLSQVSAGSPVGLDELLDGVSTSPAGVAMDLDYEAIRGAIDAGSPRQGVLQALLESAAGVLKRFVDAWASLGGAAERIAAVGGGAGHPTALQLKANVLGRPLSTLASDECAGLGALRLAAVATRRLSPALACELYPNPTARTFEPQATETMT